MEKKEQKRKSILPDVIVISAIAFVTLLLLLFSFLSKRSGDYAIVEINGAEVGRYSLYENGRFPLNGGTNVLIIEHGTARLEESNCPDHTCERTGKVSYVGQTIICLPNRLSITVKGNDVGGGVDLIS